KYYLAESYPPYKNWKIHQSAKTAAGPNMIKLPDDNILATSRRYESGSGKLCLGKIENNKLKEIIDLRSEGDCGYAGMVLKDNALYLSYYATHEQKSSIYFTRIWFKTRN